MKSCNSAAIFAFLTQVVLAVKENNMSVRPRELLRPAKTQSEPCLLMEKDVMYTSGSIVSWVCSVHGKDAKHAGVKKGNHGMVEIEGMEQVFAADAHIQSGVTTLMAEGGILKNHMLTIPPGAVLTFGTYRHTRELTVTKDVTKTVLAVRVIANNVGTTSSASEISDNIFGTSGDAVNLKTQMEGCSHGRLRIEKASGTNINKGVVTINLGNAGWNKNNLEYYAENALESLFGINTLRDRFDHVMFCLPPGTDGSWIGYGYINGVTTIYNDDWCNYPSIQMHEIGHNLGLHHAGEGGSEYGDQSGFMGYSYGYDEFEYSSGYKTKMCFNPAKSFQLGWYDADSPEIFPLAQAWSGKLVGVANYDSTAQDEYVVLKLEDGTTDFYIGYNLAYGFHAGTPESANRVTVVEQGNGSSLSSKIKVLNVGNTYTAGRVTIKVTKKVTGSKGYAYVLVYKDNACDTCCYDSDCTSDCSVATCQAGSCTFGANNCPPPTSPPTISPTKFPSNTPTTSSAPTISPTKFPSARPSISSNPTTTQYPTAAPVFPTVEIDYENFENGMGIWNLASGRQSKRVSRYRDALDISLDPTFAVKIKKDMNEASSTFTGIIAISSYSIIEVDFYFLAKNFNGDGFYLEAATDGSSSYNEAIYIQEGVDFDSSSSVWYHKTIELDVSQFQTIRIRFRCAGGDTSQVNIDHVTLTGQEELSDPTTSPSQFPSNTPSIFPSALPSTSPTPALPSTSPTTSMPSTSPSQLPSNTPTTSQPSTSPSQYPTDAPAIPNYWTQIDYENFENGMGIWNLASGRQSKRVSKFRDALDSSLDPTFAVRIKKDMNEASSTKTDIIAVSSYSKIEVAFYFLAKNFNGDGFYLEAATDGSSTYNEVIYFQESVDFDDSSSKWYHKIIESDVSGAQNIRIRFRCAGGDKAQVNIDHVTLSGSGGLPAGQEESIFHG